VDREPLAVRLHSGGSLHRQHGLPESENRVPLLARFPSNDISQGFRHAFSKWMREHRATMRSSPSTAHRAGLVCGGLGLRVPEGHRLRRARLDAEDELASPGIYQQRDHLAAAAGRSGRHAALRNT